MFFYLEIIKLFFQISHKIKKYSTKILNEFKKY